MRKFLVFALFSSLVSLAACGGGGSGGGGSLYGGPAPAAPAAPQNSGQPQQALVKGSMAWVNASGFTLYQFGADSNGVSNCNGQCTSAWPPSVPAANAQAGSGFTIITRSDGSKQWAFDGHPLYNFVGDTAADESNGDGLNEFGGHWSVSRPSAAAPTSAPSGAPTSQPTSQPTMSPTMQPQPTTNPTMSPTQAPPPGYPY